MFDTRYVRGYRDDSDELPIVIPLSRVVSVEMVELEHDRPHFVEVDWRGTQRMPSAGQIHCEYIQTTTELLYPVEFKIAVDWLDRCLAEQKAVKALNSAIGAEEDR